MPDDVIYDFGMNNGDDVEYYLLKASKVVGVEANPALCRQVERRFEEEIASGRLVVLNCALSAGPRSSAVDFYVHRTNDVLSQLGVPDERTLHDFNRIQVPSRNPADIIREHGDPRYIKIDLEGFDGQVLRAIFEAGIRPPEISAESHSADVFACLVSAGYKAFSLVEGGSVAQIYAEASIDTLSGRRKFRFKPHSAGPFGSDILGEWQDADTFFYTLAAAGLGWKDIHATDLISPAPRPRFLTHIRRQTLALARQFIRGVRGGLVSSSGR